MWSYCRSATFLKVRISLARFWEYSEPVTRIKLYGALIRPSSLKSGAVGSLRRRKGTAAMYGKVLCRSVWSPCSQGQSWNRLEQIAEADLWSRCSWLGNPIEESPVNKMCWDVRAVGVAAVWYCKITISRHRLRQTQGGIMFCSPSILWKVRGVICWMAFEERH